VKKSKTSISERDAEVARSDRRADAMFDFVKSLADAGDDKAAAFLNKLLGGGFDWPQDEPAKRPQKTAPNKGS
jgi:hypothetical protein